MTSDSGTIRVAAVADLHVGPGAPTALAGRLDELERDADVLLIAGDLTMHGLAEEAAMLARELEELSIPAITILGNHDFHSDEEKKIGDVMEAAGVTVLEGETAVLDIQGTTLGVAGIKGFGGGFPDGSAGSEFGEPEMKAFIRHTREAAERLQEMLTSLTADRRIALLHYSPIEETLVGESFGIFPFLGSYLLEQAVDAGGADLVLHGHAHAGSEMGRTAGGVPVRNVAQTVIGRSYRVLCLGPHGVV
ncbi:MAG: metallophosphoesterase [Actinomycetota bacterium]|nr:metallophosphoesterase [Actinomycetota bacterium]